MNFCLFAVKNVFRNKLRSFFVILMLTLGVLCIMTSLSLSTVVVKSIEELYGLDSDLVIYGDNLTIDDLNKIQNTKNVDDAAAVSTYVLGYDNDSMIVKSFIDQSTVKSHIIPGVGSVHLLNGSMINDKGNELVITQKTSEKLNKTVGDTIYITEIVPISLKQNSKEIQPRKVGKNFKITGIIENIKSMDGIIPPKTANQLSFNKNETVETIAIMTQSGEIEHVKNTLKDMYATIVEPSEIPKLLDKVFWYITYFIILIGGFIMMFITSKSVSERTKEIGVLKAIGWHNKRVISLILGESLTQLAIAWILSIIISIITLYIAQSNQIDITKFINSNITDLAYVLGLSVLYSLIIPLIGIILPLWRITRLKPTEALKYE